MKKKILIVSHAMELGGAERSLIGLLEAFDYDNYQVELFLLRHEGELLEDIPEKVTILPEIPAYTVLARPMIQTLREGHILLTAARLFGKIKAAYYDKKNSCIESAVSIDYSHKYTYKFMPQIQPDKKYDLAISFLTPHYIVANKVQAKKKIAWIHTDYSKVTVDVLSEQKMWEPYDNIISISDAVTESFTKVFPKFKSKVVLIENILPEELIKRQAEEFSVSAEMPEEAVRLLSIGRYCSQKNFENIPEICHFLIKEGANVNWYLIGFGPEEELIKKRIIQYKMEEKVILLGKKSNPYPYIKACDLYVQPSKYEGKSVTVREAQMLGKAVVITNFATAYSQLEDGKDGIIVPMDNNECSKGIIRILQDKEKIEQIRFNCSRRDYSNAKEIEKLYKIIK